MDATRDTLSDLGSRTIDELLEQLTELRAARQEVVLQLEELTRRDALLRAEEELLVKAAAYRQLQDAPAQVSISPPAATVRMEMPPPVVRTQSYTHPSGRRFTTREQIKHVMSSRPQIDAWRPRDVTEALERTGSDKDPQAVRQALRRMVRDGELEKLSNGSYALHQTLET